MTRIEFISYIKLIAMITMLFVKSLESIMLLDANRKCSVTEVRKSVSDYKSFRKKENNSSAWST